jgi:hypothetical protein
MWRVKGDPAVLSTALQAEGATAAGQTSAGTSCCHSASPIISAKPAVPPIFDP